MMGKLSRLVSCVPGFEFCRDAVDASPENELLKSEIVDAYEDVEREVQKVVGDFCFSDCGEVRWSNCGCISRDVEMELCQVVGQQI